MTSRSGYRTSTTPSYHLWSDRRSQSWSGLPARDVLLIRLEVWRIGADLQRHAETRTPDTGRLRCGAPVSARIAFIGAGSVEFTKNLLGDILTFPELADAEIALHDIDDERLEAAEADRPLDERSRRRLGHDQLASRPARGTRGGGLRRQHGAGRDARGDGARLRDPAAARAPPDDRRHARNRRHLPRAAHDPGAARDRRGHGP